MRINVFYVIAGLSTLLLGCGGSSSSSSGTGADLGPAFSEYVATLPNGASMLLTLGESPAGYWSGDFADTAITGADADEAGEFSGTVSGTQVRATCTSDDGATFTLSGTHQHGRGFTLTRSDMPGAELTFTPVVRLFQNTRSSVNFNLTLADGQSFPASIDTTPVYSNSTYRRYSGKWRNRTIGIELWTNGKGEFVIGVETNASIFAKFPALALSDFGSRTVSGGTTKTFLNFYGSSFQDFKIGGNQAAISP